MQAVYFNKKRIGKTVLIALCAALVFAVCFLIDTKRDTAVPEYVVSQKNGRIFTEVSDIKSREKFFKQFSINIIPESEKKDKVIIPEKFTSVYKSYNRIQKKAGFDLEKYKGIKVERARYTLKDSGKAVILVHRGSVIAGHRFSGIYGEKYSPLIKQVKNGKN